MHTLHDNMANKVVALLEKGHRPVSRLLVVGGVAQNRAVRDLLLHERLLAKLAVTDQTFTRLLDGLEREGFERFAESLATPEMRGQLTRAVNDGLVSFLRIPLRDRLAGMGPEKQAALAA